MIVSIPTQLPSVCEALVFGDLDHVDVTIGGDKWEVSERDGRLCIRLRESNGSISRSLTVLPIAQNSIELGTVRR